MYRFLKRLIIAYLLIMLFTLCSYAETVSVDAFTGEEIAPDGTTSMSLITPVCRYDSKTKFYVFSTGAESGTDIISNVADGQVVQHSVSIYPQENVTTALYLNGDEVSGVDLGSIGDIGSYRLFAVDALGNSTRLIDFTIIGQTTNLIQTFTVPQGFYILSAMKDGEAIATGDRTLNMEEEGYYIVDYACVSSGVTYTLKTMIDRTPPTLALEALNGGYSASGPVDISDLESGCMLEILKDGNEYHQEGVLTESGVYQLTLTDAAGNVNVYDFKINLYFDVNAWVALVLLLIVLIGIEIDIINARRKFRVR